MKITFWQCGFHFQVLIDSQRTPFLALRDYRDIFWVKPYLHHKQNSVTLLPPPPQELKFLIFTPNKCSKRRKGKNVKGNQVAPSVAPAIKKTVLAKESVSMSLLGFFKRLKHNHPRLNGDVCFWNWIMFLLLDLDWFYLSSLSVPDYPKTL